MLVAPEIASNSGNIIRLCANAGSRLHLVRPLGYDMENAKLRRAGLDYHELATVVIHDNWELCKAELHGRRLFAFSSKATNTYEKIAYDPTDVLVFGAERSGLSPEIAAEFPQENLLRIPMRPQNRSLNLGNACSIVLFEAWRQHGFVGSSDYGDPEAGFGMIAEGTELLPYDR